MKTLLILLTCLIGFGCSKKNKAPLTHTYKLQRPLKVFFSSNTEIEIKRGSEVKNISIKIYLKNDKEKLLIEETSSIKTNKVTLNLPDDLSNYSYIIVIAKGLDSHNNELSAVDTYKIGEQKLINNAKKKLKNRN